MLALAGDDQLAGASLRRHRGICARRAGVFFDSIIRLWLLRSSILAVIVGVSFLAGMACSPCVWYIRLTICRWS
jgi:hypothetical protein